MIIHCHACNWNSQFGSFFCTLKERAVVEQYTQPVAFFGYEMHHTRQSRSAQARKRICDDGFGSLVDCRQRKSNSPRELNFAVKRSDKRLTVKGLGILGVVVGVGMVLLGLQSMESIWKARPIIRAKLAILWIQTEK
jgi:hypothetical protein